MAITRCLRVIVVVWLTWFVVSGATMTTAMPLRLGGHEALPWHADTVPAVVTLCPVGGQRYPEETRDCPIHHVPLLELIIARARVPERQRDG